MVSVTLETHASPAQGLAPKSTRPEPSSGVGSFAAIIDSNASQAAGADRASASQASVKPSEPRSTSVADQGTGQGTSQGSAANNSLQDQADQTASAPQTQQPSPSSSAKSASASATKGNGKAATGEIAAPDSSDAASGLNSTDDDQVAATTDTASAMPAPIAAVVVVPISPVDIAVPVTTGQAPAPLRIAAAAIATSAAASAPVNFATAQPAESSAPSAPTPFTAPVASGSLSANPAIIADAAMTTSSQTPDGAALTAASIEPKGPRIDVTLDQQQSAAELPAAVSGTSPSVIAEATSMASSAINDAGLTAAIAASPVPPKPVLLKTSVTAATITTPAVDTGKAPGPAADEVPVTADIISPVPAAGVVATAAPTKASADRTKLDSESTPARTTDAPTPASAPPPASAPAHTTLATEAGNLAAVTTETTSLTSNLQPPSTSPTLAPAPTWNASAAPIVVPLSGLAIEFAASIKSGKSSFQIRLDPAELGRIDVRIDVDRTGQVTSHLTVEKAETLAMLRQDAPQLQRALDGTGLKTGDNGLQFSLRDQSSQNSQGQNPGNDSARNLQRLVITEDDQIPPVLAGQTYGRLLGSSSGIDIRV